MEPSLFSASLRADVIRRRPALSSPILPFSPAASLSRFRCCMRLDNFSFSNCSEIPICSKSRVNRWRLLLSRAVTSSNFRSCWAICWRCPASWFLARLMRVLKNAVASLTSSG